MTYNLKIIYYIVCSLFICSCAHKSGHRREKKQSEQIMNNQTLDDIMIITEEIPLDNDTNIDYGSANLVSSNQKYDGKEIFAKYNKAVFMVFTTDGMNTYQGSGFFISSTGIAVSNYHVFQGTSIGAEAIKLVGSETAYKVTDILARNEDEDFIIFKVNITNTDFIPISYEKPSVGERVFTIGSPYGLENTFSSGEVSQWRDTNLMQISAQIDHGSSGGALINEYGEAIGITTGSFADGSQANLNYAWSIDVIKPYIK